VGKLREYRTAPAVRLGNAFSQRRFDPPILIAMVTYPGQCSCEEQAVLFRHPPK